MMVLRVQEHIFSVSEKTAELLELLEPPTLQMVVVSMLDQKSDVTILTKIWEAVTDGWSSITLA